MWAEDKYHASLIHYIVSNFHKINSLCGRDIIMGRTYGESVGAAFRCRECWEKLNKR